MVGQLTKFQELLDYKPDEKSSSKNPPNIIHDSIHYFSIQTTEEAQSLNT